MPVLWKRLCTLGLLFWVGLTAFDYYHGSILVPGEFDHKNDGKGDETVEEKKPDILQFQISNENKQDNEANEWSYWTYSFSFISAMTFFTVGYLSWKLYPKKIQNSAEIDATNDAIRAALFENGFDAVGNDENNDILIIQENKLDASVNRFKAKEETAAEALANREITALNKRLDGLNEEKRNLTRFLAQSEKDNRIIKQKMMEVLREKNVLLKRLESATREIRSNTVARQATLDKLEESIQCSNQLKVQIQQMSAEKSELLRRLRQVETQYKTLRRQQDKDNKGTGKSKSGSNGLRQTSHIKNVDNTKDIEQIEMKLHDLEASLEKMKTNNKTSEEFESEDNDDSSESYEPKILRQVSSSDMNFLSEVEPSYTNLLAKFDCEPNHQIVESITPAVTLNKFAVNTFVGSALFNVLKLVQKHHQHQQLRHNHHSESISDLLMPREPVIVNYSIVCNYKCPYAERLAMLGSNYFGKTYFGWKGLSDTKSKKDDDVEQDGFGCHELVKYVQHPRNIL